jgi:UDP-N-acetylmuramoylalanine--D-glutamate ligase
VTNLHTIPWRRVGVMGLGLSGRAAAGYLARRGVSVTAADAKPREALAPTAALLEGLGASLRLGPRAEDAALFAGCEVVVASPGVPPACPPLAGARAAGIPVIAEVELAARVLRGVIVGITGSNGKSTVTELTGSMMSASGIETRVCGNIGTPLMEVAEADEALEPARAGRVHYVVELSSFQLEGIETLAPRVAVLLNLSPDHQDRYATSEEYYAAKARLFMNQRAGDVAILNWDDPPVRARAADLPASVFPFSLTQDLPEGAVRAGDDLVLRRGGRREALMPAKAVGLRGRHNLENVLASAAAAVHCGAAVAACAQAAASFRGLPHRLEFVAQVGGVSWFNDSKATNVGAARRALEAFHEPIVLLMGGYDKGGAFEELREPLADVPGGVRALITFGKAGDDIARRLDGAVLRLERAGSLADAVSRAAKVARPGDVVLLAPACASFDAYNGFAQRGEDFRRLVHQMTPRMNGGLG